MDRGIPWGPCGPKDNLYIDLGHQPEDNSQVEALSSSASTNEPEDIKLERIQTVQSSENEWLVTSLIQRGKFSRFHRNTEAEQIF